MAVPALRARPLAARSSSLARPIDLRARRKIKLGRPASGCLISEDRLSPPSSIQGVNAEGKRSSGLPSTRMDVLLAALSFSRWLAVARCQL